MIIMPASVRFNIGKLFLTVCSHILFKLSNGLTLVKQLRFLEIVTGNVILYFSV